MKSIFRKYFKTKREASIFALALLVQCIIFGLTVTVASGGFLWTSDAENYFDIARNLLETGGFYLHPDLLPQTLRTPLYPIFIAGIFGPTQSLALVIIIQNIIAAYVVVLVYRVGKTIFNEKAALLGTLLFLFEARRLTNASQLMSETVFLLFFVLSVWWVMQYLHEPRKHLIIQAGTAAGLATLTRPFMLPLVILFALGILLKRKAMTTKHAIMLVGITIAVIAPWSIRNYQHYQTFSLSSSAGANAYFTAVPRFLEYKEPGVEKYDELVHKALVDLDYQPVAGLSAERAFVKYGIFEFQYQDYLVKEAKEIIAQDIPLFARVVVQKMGVFFIESSASRSYSTLLYNLQLPSQVFYPFLYFGGRIWWTLMFIFMAIGLYSYMKSEKNTHRIIGSILILMMIYFAGISSMNKDAPRLRLPVTPIITLCAAYGWHIAKQRKTCQD